jgi:hypothetical protein
MFEDYPVHVLTTVLKAFFRELPEPLLTFELFDDFLRGSGMLLLMLFLDNSLVRTALEGRKCWSRLR